MSAPATLTALLAVLAATPHPMSPLLAGRDAMSDVATDDSRPDPVLPANRPLGLPVPDSVRVGLGFDPGLWLDDLALSLTEGLSFDLTKARVLHDWVALNIEYDTSWLGADSVPELGVAEVIAGGRSTCEGYANLYERLCEHAGLECVTIAGRARGEEFRVLEAEQPHRSNHAWNAVRIRGRWRLVDATWNSGRIGENGYVTDYSTDYLFIEPDEMIHTHFPTDSSWQLLDPPYTAEEFTRLPYLRAAFFRFGLALAAPLERITRVGRTARIELVVPKHTYIRTWLMTPARERTGDPIPAEHGRSRTSIVVRFPAPGEWIVAVYARRGTRDGLYEGVARFGFVSDF